jgi:hypothetical protein
MAQETLVDGQRWRENVVNVKMFSLISIAAALTLGGPAHAQRVKREVGAHQHGASKLNLAIEGQTIAMELSAPADDIVGFEARPRTDKQKAAVEQATATLRDPLKLFTLPPAAGCTVASASVEQVFGEGPTPEPSDHSEFEGRYSLSCTNVAAVLDIEFPYFKLFPKVDEVEVQVISPKGQKSFEIKRARPRLSLRNLTS